jgi:DNA adenine methylase
MPPHTTYVEPFAGSGSVLLAKPPVAKEILNDKNKAVMQVHRGLKHRAEVWDMSPSRKRWERIKSTSPSQRSGRDQAFFIDHSWGGKGQNYTSSGKSGKMDTGKLHQREKDVLMVNDDFAEVMRRWDSDTTLHYLDPPYTQHADVYAEHGVTPERVSKGG